MRLTRDIRRGLVGAALVAASFSGAFAQDSDDSADKDTPRTRTPIKHLIYSIGENCSFDNVFGVYRPRDGQRIANLLSAGIVNLDGSPSANFAQGKPFQVTTPEASGKFLLNPTSKSP